MPQNYKTLKSGLTGVTASAINDALSSNTSGLVLPNGTTAQRSGSPSSGTIRYNSTTGLGEIYTATGWAVLGNSPPTVTGVSPSTFNGNAGTQFTITGSSFANDAIVKFITNDGTEYDAQTVTFVDSTTIRATTSRDFTVAEEPLDVKVVQQAGASTKLDCIDCGGLPSWSTASGTLVTLDYSSTASQAVNTSVTATDSDSGDSVTYSITSGSLPSGLTLNSSTGAITGNAAEPGASSVTTNFTITATDLGSNTSARAFNIVRRWVDGSSSATAAASASAIYSLTSGSSASGVYWIKPSGYATAFQTYCLMNSFGGSHWMLMFLVRDAVASSNFAYDASYWATLTPLNVSSGNLNYTSNTGTDVATEIVNSFAFQYVVCSFYGRDSNLSTYLLGSATDSAPHLLTAYTSVGLTMTKTGAGSDAESVRDYSYSLTGGIATSGFPQYGTPGNQWRYNQSQNYSNGFSYARFGQAIATENYQSYFYSNNGRGLGIKSTLGGGSYAASAGFGYVNSRTNAGGSGPSGAINNSSKVEIWVR